mgnify:FL=1
MRKIYFDKARKLSHTAAILMIMIAVVMVIAGVTVYAEGETGIKLDKKTLNLEIGETVKLEATITPEGGNLDDVKWSSSSEKVATVKKGEVTALKAGITLITASYKGVEAHCYVYVEKVEAPEKISIKVAEGNVNETQGGYTFTVGCKDKTLTQIGRASCRERV